MSEGGVATASDTTTVGDSAEMSVYKKEACKVTTFRIVYDKDDLNSEHIITFKPEMAHQIFGDSESIFGYRNLTIGIYYLHNSCRCYLNLEKSGEIQKENMQPDDVLKALDEVLPSDFTRSLEDFCHWIDQEVHDEMYGEVINTFDASKPLSRFPDKNVPVSYKITKNDMSNRDFTDFHANFETYIMWFIDAANFIDLDDSRWLIFYVYEEFEHPGNKKIFRSPIAFCSVYKFFAYPDKVRARISQCFVLPIHQKVGIGTRLYETIARNLRADDKVIDITVEEPTPAFQKIRDLEDCGILHKELEKKKWNYFTTSSKKIFEMGRHQKIGKRQIQRAYDILGLYYANQKGPIEYKKVLEHIKARISDENERESKPGKRFCNLQGAPTHIQLDKKSQIETEFKRHCDDIEPSVKYLETHLEEWLQRNKHDE